MKRYFLNGVEISDKTGFKDNQDASYPSGWLSTMPEEALVDYGITILEEPEVVVESPKPITEVTMRQARLALLGAGLLDDVTTTIAQLPSPTKEAAVIEWEYAQTVYRNQGLVVNLAGALGLTEAQIDSLFLTASTL